ncbi:MAG: DUF3880 domain-containing protein [Lachnospira sp.]
MKILFYKWQVFNQSDIKNAFEQAGCSVSFYEEDSETRKSTDLRLLTDVIKEYDLVFSVNYFSRLSDACMLAKRKYAAWTVDSPMISMYHKSVFNPCNYLFIFDKFCYLQFKQMGVKNIFYLPLAADAKRIEFLIEQTPDSDLKKFESDISFVGGMYHKNSYDAIYDSLPDYLKGYFDAVMQAQLDIFGENIFDRLLSVDILQKLSDCVQFQNEPDSFSDLKLIFTNTFLGFKMAQIERIECLNMLAKNFNVDLYTDKSHDALHNINIRGTVDYNIDMPKVFNQSKINMNFTIRNIRSGLPLRIWDILAAGGFLLTNFQAEIPYFFENQKDIVYYENLYDMQKKAEYYLAHDDERMMIAANGHKKVNEFHSYHQRIAAILSAIK